MNGTGLRKLAFFALFAAQITGCAGNKAAGKSPSSSASTLTGEEIVKSGFVDALATVQSLRPQWLTVRGVTSLRSNETIKVYLDGNLYGGVESLRQIQVNSVERIRHMDGMEASSRYGLNHGAGAIIVETKH